MKTLPCVCLKKDLFRLLDDGATLITPNNRLSNALLEEFTRLKYQPVQAKPICIPYQAFLRQAFQQLCHQYPWEEHPILLNAQQCRFAWQQILSQAYNPVNVGLCDAIQEAWISCHLWSLDFSNPLFQLTEQTALFQKVATLFQETLDKKSAMTEVQLAPYLYEHPDFIFPTKKIVWVCFDDFPPQQKKLQTVLYERGIEQYQYDLTATDFPTFKHESKNDEEEWMHLFSWINHRLSLNEKHIAVVVPDLEANYSFLKRRLSQEFQPEQWNISLGQSLVDQPLIAHALSWLKLDTGILSRADARLLLHSPYLVGSEKECFTRAHYLEEPAILNAPFFNVAHFIRVVAPRAPLLAEALSQLESYPSEASLDEWIQLFYQRLSLLGFPGEYSLNSESYQAYQRLITLLDEWMALAFIQVTFCREEALSSLETFARTTLFQPKKPQQAPLQILGLLEASGCEFDSLWVMHATEQQLPKASRLSPFIPPQLQREFQMPHATPEREMRLAESMINRFTCASKSTVFSYSRLSGEQLKRPSPLIGHLPNLDSVCNEADAVLPALLEIINEDYILPLQPSEKTRGGTRVLATQAQCPFKAFATHRLQAKSVPSTTEGPGAKERGQWIHRILERIWRHLNDQKNLLALSEAELTHLVRSITQETIDTSLKEWQMSLSPLIQEMEEQRLEKLTQLALAWDKERPPFVVEAVEAAYTINLGGLELKVRIDRLDRFVGENEEKALIDYKSQLPSVLPWNDTRPTEPQLLLYSLLNAEITALIFAQLNNGQFVCRGLSQNDNAIPGVKPLKTPDAWEEQRILWKEELDNLATEYLSGRCEPKPKYQTLCQRCDYRNLCRIDAIKLSNL